MIVAKGTLYGTSVYGGGSGCGGAGCGTVFSVSPAGKESVAHSFAWRWDGARICSGVADLHDRVRRGARAVQFDLGRHRMRNDTSSGSLAGEVKSISPTFGWLRRTAVSQRTHRRRRHAVRNDGGRRRPEARERSSSITKSGKLQTLYSFQDIPDGNLPGANLLYLNGNFYSTTVGGGNDRGRYRLRDQQNGQLWACSTASPAATTATRPGPAGGRVQGRTLQHHL